MISPSLFFFCTCYCFCLVILSYSPHFLFFFFSPLFFPPPPPPPAVSLLDGLLLIHESHHWQSPICSAVTDGNADMQVVANRQAGTSDMGVADNLTVTTDCPTTSLLSSTRQQAVALKTTSSTANTSILRTMSGKYDTINCFIKNIYSRLD